MTRPTFSAIWKEKELWLLILIPVLYYYRPLFTNESFYFRDLYAHFIPQRHHLVQFLKSGILPLWDPYLHGWQPCLAGIYYVGLFPTVLIYLVLPLLTAFNIYIVLHLVLAGIAAYMLARVLNLQPIASFVCGLISSCCGYTLSL